MKFVATNATVTDDQPATEKILPRKHGTIPRKIRRGVGYFGPILTRVRMPLLPLLVPHITGHVSVSLDQCSVLARAAETQEC